MPHVTVKPLDVLVVDDDPLDRQLIQKAFDDAKSEIQLHFKSNGASALDYLLGRDGEVAGKPDACLFDINMPGLSGIDLLRKLKGDADLRKIPVVMLSSSDRPEDIDQCYDLQACGYVCKPSDYREMNEIVAAIANFWENTVKFRSRTG